jgi:hypothetical protein
MSRGFSVSVNVQCWLYNIPGILTHFSLIPPSFEMVRSIIESECVAVPSQNGQTGYIIVWSSYPPPFVGTVDWSIHLLPSLVNDQKVDRSM